MTPEKLIEKIERIRMVDRGITKMHRAINLVGWAISSIDCCSDLNKRQAEKMDRAKEMLDKARDLVLEVTGEKYEWIDVQKSILRKALSKEKK